MPTASQRLGAALLAGAPMLGVAGCDRSSSTAAPTFTVAAASDLSRAFEELGARYFEKTGRRPIFTFGSTGLLGKQLHEGAPFDVFAAASVQFVDEAVSAGDCDGSTKALYGRGRIVLWARKGAPLPRSLADLSGPGFARIAIANPEHAPYGRAAKEALQRDGVWDRIAARIVYGENVQQTLQFAQSGNADVSIVALSLALAATDGDHVPVGEDLYRPIDQALVVCRHGKAFELGRDFAAFVASEAGRAIMKRHGFLLPGEATARSP